MPRAQHPAPLAAAAAFLVAGLAAAPALAAVSGIVVGPGGVYAHARVCLDRRNDARCDAHAKTATTDAEGRFTLPGHGGVVAEVDATSQLVDRATGAKTAVRRPLVLRAGPGASVVGPVSTELQAMVEGGGAGMAATLATRLHVPPEALVAGTTDPDDQAALDAEQARLMDRIADATAAAGRRGDRVAELGNRLDLEEIRNVVVIYAENRSFNNLFADFPGTPSLASLRRSGQLVAQKDRDGSVLATLPPAWGGLTAAGQRVVVTQAQTTHVLPNAPFQVDATRPAWGAPAVTNAVITRDLYHRFYENQMQIDGGANDKFAAWGDAGGLVMGYFDGSRTALWKLAKQYTLADRFFQGAFGGSFLNHQYLICACMPVFPDADSAPAHPSITVLRAGLDGAYTHELALAPNSPASALDGPPVYVKSGNLTPRNYLGDGTFHAVNTMQPAYQPSNNPPAADDRTGLRADPAAATTLPAQDGPTIGNTLDARAQSWAWYSGAWNAALADRRKVYADDADDFQSHHQPFNYYAFLDPVTHASDRAMHLKDLADLEADAAAGSLPAVSFYKPAGSNTEHPGYASLAVGDAHIASVVAALQAGPQWKHMLIVVTYDENGGQWDSVAPPRGDLVGPGTRIPAVIISPFARRGAVDHTPYDTGSIARFITHRFSLERLPGIAMRDEALAANGEPPMGDLTNALDFRRARHAAR